MPRSRREQLSWVTPRCRNSFSQPQNQGRRSPIAEANLSLSPRKVNEPKVPCSGTKVRHYAQRGWALGRDLVEIWGFEGETYLSAGFAGRSAAKTRGKRHDGLTFAMPLQHNLG